MTEQELNKKLAEWRFPDATSIDVDEHGIWVHNPGTFDSIGVSRGSELIELFTQSPSACFKWLVPKVMDTIQHRRVDPVNSYQYQLFLFLQEWIMRIAYGDAKPALALCLAIEKLIDGEK